MANPENVTRHPDEDEWDFQIRLMVERANKGSEGMSPITDLQAKYIDIAWGELQNALEVRNLPAFKAALAKFEQYATAIVRINTRHLRKQAPESGTF